MGKRTINAYCSNGGVKKFKTILEFSEHYGISRNVWNRKNSSLANHGFIFFLGKRKDKVVIATKDNLHKNNVENFLNNSRFRNLEPVKTNFHSILEQNKIFKESEFKFNDSKPKEEISEVKEIPKNEKPIKEESNSEPTTNVKLSPSLNDVKKIAADFFKTNELNGFNNKTMEGCGTLVKNMDSNTKVIAPLLGNLVVNGVKITLTGSFMDNGNGNPQVILKGFEFKEEEVKEEDLVKDFFSQNW